MSLYLSRNTQTDRGTVVSVSPQAERPILLFSGDKLGKSQADNPLANCESTRRSPLTTMKIRRAGQAFTGYPRQQSELADGSPDQIN